MILFELVMPLGSHKPFFLTKIFNFEYWPFWLFYFPMYFYGIYLAMKSRSAMYFSTANPAMKYGGVMGESKYKVLASLPAEFVPKTIFVSSSTPYSSIIKLVSDHGLCYPVIIKPDVGERGKDVEKINNENELQSYLKGKTTDLNIQEFIHRDLEFGIMYHRMPGENMGSITSVVQKGFLYITGDGRKTLQELMHEEIRISNRLNYFEKKYAGQLQDVVPEGEKMYLEPIGNHCRGTTFYNANHIINKRLTSMLNNIALQIDGYYYGRFDLKVDSLEDLYAGKNLQFIELNGVSSEVAHIYDPEYKLIKAYRDVFTHMKYIYQIARKNHENGVPYDSLMKFIKDLRMHLKRQP